MSTQDVLTVFSLNQGTNPPSSPTLLQDSVLECDCYADI